jgi:hypothetical protein
MPFIVDVFRLHLVRLREIFNDFGPDYGIGESTDSFVGSRMGMGIPAKSVPCLHLFVPPKIEDSHGHD